MIVGQMQMMQKGGKMAKIHDLFIVELAEVIKGYGNDPDVEDPFRLSEFYRFYELPNIAVSRENFEKMRPIEPERNNDAAWNALSKVYNMQGVPDEAKSIIGDVMLSLGSGGEQVCN